MHRQQSSGTRKMSAEMLDTAEETIIDYLTCPICRDYIQPPSCCCENGHFICSKDKQAITKCPICSTENYPNKINTIFDMILKEIYFPCINQESGCPGYYKYGEIQEHQKLCGFELAPCAYKSEGCTQMVKRNEKSYHEKICEYGIISCRIHLEVKAAIRVNCDWRGFRTQLYQHVSEKHQMAWMPHLESNVTFAWILPIKFNFIKIEMIYLKDLDEMFYFYSKSDADSMQYIAVQYVGSQEKSMEYRYCVEFELESKRVQYEDMVLPYSVSADDVYSSSNCFHIHCDFLKKHFQAERVIDCYVKIFRKDQMCNQLKRHITYLGNVINED